MAHTLSLSVFIAFKGAYLYIFNDQNQNLNSLLVRVSPKGLLE